MYTKKIIIKDEKHFNEVVKALKSIGEKITSDTFYSDFVMLVFDDETQIWLRVYKMNIEKYKSVPEYEIVTKTLYELKEVPYITCIQCGKKHYKDSETYFKFSGDFLVEPDNEDNTIINDAEKTMYFCKGCLKVSFEKYIEYVNETISKYTL